jgi:hypothetical protein
MTCSTYLYVVDGRGCVMLGNVAEACCVSAGNIRGVMCMSGLT